MDSKPKSRGLAMSPRRKASKASVSSPKRKLPKPMGMKMAVASPKRRGRKASGSAASPRSRSASSVGSSHSGKYNVPLDVYPAGFDICGYAKELYDANRDKKTFEYADFHKAMCLYSMVFCYEKELRVLNAKRNKKHLMKFAWAGYDGAESALKCIFDNTKNLLVKSEANEITKNQDIKEAHMKGILDILKECAQCM
jgi:hypothetical protein